MFRNLKNVGVLFCLSLAVACGDDGDGKGNNTTNPTNNNTTETNNETNNETTPTTTGPTNNDTTVMGTQCNAVGETCTVGDPTRAGFVCEDLGLGATCAQACTPPAEGAQYPCPSGQACLAATTGGPTFCAVSQCNGWNDTTSCDAFNYENGATCVGAVNNSFLCLPGGTVDSGGACTSDSQCAAGNLCFEGECMAICNDDSGCETGERCFGDTDSFIDQGVGLCLVGCDTYSTGQCPAGLGCFPVLEEDSLCEVVGDVEAYEECTPMNPNNPMATNPCAEGSICQRWVTGSQTGVCTPLCGSNIEESCDGTCIPLLNTTSEIVDGVCFQDCGLDDYGQSTCPEDLHCRPFFGESVCAFSPAGTNSVGDPCDPQAATTDCVEGAFCEAAGDGTAGVCRAYCDLRDGDTNALLSCSGTEVCQPLLDELGVCGEPCDPTGFTDTSCPAGLQTCLPGEVPICTQSGPTAVGEACDSIFENECEAGSICTNRLNVSIFEQADIDAQTDPGVCRSLCDPFGSDCGDGFHCVVDWLNPVKGVGFCLERSQPAPTTQPLGACETAQEACADRGFCAPGAANNICVVLCDPSRPAAEQGCPATLTCTTTTLHPDTGEEVDQSVGPYGLCLP